MMARQTGSEAEFNALLRLAEQDGIKCAKEFPGIKPQKEFFNGGNEPRLIKAFLLSWERNKEISE